MAPIETILCPVDFSSITRPELDLAAELARIFGARLVLHHNLPATGFGMAKGWEWKAAHPEQAADAPIEERLEELRGRLPPGLDVETLVTRGPLAVGLAELARELPADLMVLACHGCDQEEHASLTEDLLARSDCPILAIHEGEGRRHVLHLRPDEAARPLTVLVPTDLSDEAAAVARYAFRLARLFRMEVHLMHAMPGSHPSVVPVDFTGPAVYHEAVIGDARARLEELVPEDLVGQVRVHVAFGRPDDVILDHAQTLDPDLIVMGEHARSFLRRFLTRDTSKEILHRAACPVWFVPPGRAA